MRLFALKNIGRKKPKMVMFKMADCETIFRVIREHVHRYFIEFVDIQEVPSGTSNEHSAI